jgi:hypothetical protein
MFDAESRGIGEMIIRPTYRTEDGEDLFPKSAFKAEIESGVIDSLRFALERLSPRFMHYTGPCPICSGPMVDYREKPVGGPKATEES